MVLQEQIKNDMKMLFWLQGDGRVCDWLMNRV